MESGAPTPRIPERSREHVLRCDAQGKASLARRRVVGENLARGIEPVKIGCYVAGIACEPMRRQLFDDPLDDARKFHEPANQRDFRRMDEPGQVRSDVVGRRRAGAGVAQHRDDSRVSVLDVIDGVVVVLGDREG